MPARLSSPNSALVTIRDLVELFQVSERTIRQWSSEGRLPEPLRISNTIVRWRRSDIEAMIGQHEKTG